MPRREKAQLITMEELKEMHRGSISVCMIARDEEEHIAEALASVKDLADEMIVVDTGSKDATILEAKRHGAKVYEIHWNNDFSEARNFALSKATKEWILVLDADERVSRATTTRRSALSRDEAESAAFMFEQRTYTNASCGPGLQSRFRSGRDASMACAARLQRSPDQALPQRTPVSATPARFTRTSRNRSCSADIPVRESGLVDPPLRENRAVGPRVPESGAWCALAREGHRGVPRRIRCTSTRWRSSFSISAGSTARSLTPRWRSISIRSAGNSGTSRGSRT